MSSRGASAGRTLQELAKGCQVGCLSRPYVELPAMTKAPLCGSGRGTETTKLDPDAGIMPNGLAGHRWPYPPVAYTSSTSSRYGSRRG